jgi:hypothetical protein
MQNIFFGLLLSIEKKVEKTLLTLETYKLKGAKDVCA